MLGKQELLANLNQFTGTTQWYRHSLFRKYLYTDGMQYLAENAGCYWLLDHILIHQSLPEIAKEEFQNWKIVVTNSEATITVDDGNDNIIKKWKGIYTDFPLSEINLFFENNVLHLPSER